MSVAFFEHGIDLGVASQTSDSKRRPYESRTGELGPTEPTRGEHTERRKRASVRSLRF